MLSSPHNSSTDPTHQFAPAISRCISTRNLKLGMLLHSHFIKTALTFNPFLCNRLMELYSKCDSLQNAQKAFDDLPTKNTHSWNAMISAYSRMGLFPRAHHLFDKMPDPNVVTFNSLISGLTRHGFYKESISLLGKMQDRYECVVMDEFTLVSVLGACACLGALELVRQVHGVALGIGLELNTIIYNSLIDAYGKCGKSNSAYSVFSRMGERDIVSWTSMVVSYARANRMQDAHCLFDRMPTKNTVSWTSLITGFVQNGCGNEALDLFEQMREERILPSSFTFVSVLSACADLARIEKGKQIHAHIIRSSSGNDYLYNVFILNSLIDMYCKCGDINSANTLFKRMPKRDVVSWNSLITGFAQNGHGEESLIACKNMMDSGIKPNQVTFLGVLSACGHTGLVSEGLQILELMEEKYSVSPKPEHYAILIDLLARKNRIEDAMELIKRVPKGSNQIGMWGALLGACHVHGNLDLAQEAADALFELEPKNAGRYVILSKVYAEAGKWHDAHHVWKLMEERDLRKEAACSWIEVRSIRHQFVARDRAHCQMQEIYEVIDSLVDQMTDARSLLLSQILTPCE